MRVQDRDLDLVGWVNGFGFVDVEAVCLLWGVSYEAARRRLAKLVGAGLFEAERSMLDGRKVFWPTREGVELAGDELGPIKGVRWVTSGHDLAIVALAVRLERETGGRFEAERRLRRRQGLSGVGVPGHVPDGVLHIEGKRPVAVEVEFSTKPKRRLKEIIDGYRRNFEYSEVHYFAGSKSILDRLNESFQGDSLFKAELLNAETK